jgi:hypothetical protein
LCFSVTEQLQSTVAVACSALLGGKIMATCLQPNIGQTIADSALSLHWGTAGKEMRARSKMILPES